MPLTIEKLKGATYRRDSKVWTKVGRIRSKWYVSLGFAGDAVASHVWDARTKSHAETISQGWFEDYGDGTIDRKLSEHTLCPYHQDSLGWDACTDGFNGCEVNQARKSR